MASSKCSAFPAAISLTTAVVRRIVHLTTAVVKRVGATASQPRPSTRTTRRPPRGFSSGSLRRDHWPQGRRRGPRGTDLADLLSPFPPLPLGPYGEGSQFSAAAPWTWTPRHTGPEGGEGRG